MSKILDIINVTNPGNCPCLTVKPFISTNLSTSNLQPSLGSSHAQLPVTGSEEGPWTGSLKKTQWISLLERPIHVPFMISQPLQLFFAGHIIIAWCVSVEPQPLVFADIHREQRIWELPSSWNCRVWLREGGRVVVLSTNWWVDVSQNSGPQQFLHVKNSVVIFLVGNHFNLAPWFWNIAKVDSWAWGPEVWIPSTYRMLGCPPSFLKIRKLVNWDG